MEKQVLAEVVSWEQWRNIEEVMSGDRVVELLPGEVHTVITLSARGRELRVEVVGEEVLSFLEGN